MGRYVDIADVTAFWPNDQLVQLTNDERTGERDVVDAIVELAIGWAEDQADTVLARRYVVPLVVVPGVVKQLVLDGTIYRLYQRAAKDQVIKAEDRQILPGQGWLKRLETAAVDLPGVALRADVRVKAAQKEADDVRRYY